MKLSFKHGTALKLLLTGVGVFGGISGAATEATDGLKLFAPFGFRGNITASSVDLAWLPPSDRLVSKYDVQAKQVSRTPYSSDLTWKTIHSDVLGLNLDGEGVMSPGEGLHEVQEVESRADAGSPITSGYFRLSFSTF